MDSIEFIDDDFQQEDQVRLTLKDLLALCISKWKWFVISLAVIMGFTVIYLLRCFGVKQRCRYGYVLQQNQCGQRAHQHPVS